jgi:glycosyltransferase involved in cell wall biosynthesis
MTLRINRPVSTIWLDVTLLLVVDPKQPTGIPRTTAELFRAWHHDGYVNLRLCRLDMKRGAYTEVTPEQVLGRFPPPGGETSGPPSIRARIAALAQRALARSRDAYHTLPLWFRRLVRQICSGLETAHYHVRRWIGWPSFVPLNLGPGDVVFSPGGAWNYPGSGKRCRQLREQMGFRAVHLVYDMIPYKFPQLFEQDFPAKIHRWMRESFPACDLILAISHSTRRDVLEYFARYQLPAPPVEVVRLGELTAHGEDDVPPVVKGFDPARPFVLSVGTLEVRKNHLLLYHAWRRLIEKHGRNIPPLVLAGSVGWLTGDVVYQMRNDPLTRDHMVLINGCGDRQLRWLYRHCLFTVYPSHYEGWGLPIAESLAYGKYCIASNTSSMPEIDPTGELVEHHDPCDLPTCLNLITEALDSNFRSEKEALIRRSYHRTSWEEAGRQVISRMDRHFGSTLRKADGDGQAAVARSA